MQKTDKVVQWVIESTRPEHQILADPSDKSVLAALVKSATDTK